MFSGSGRRTHGQPQSDAQIRLYSGLVLFVCALAHFINHAFGLISIEADDGRAEVAHARLAKSC